MSESLVGRAVASMRQNAGRVIGVAAADGVNGPAATSVDDLIVTLGMVSAARLSHAVPGAAAVVAIWASNGMNAAVRAAARRPAMMNASWACVLYGARQRPIDDSCAAFFAAAPSGSSQYPSFTSASTAAPNCFTNASCDGYSDFAVAASNNLVRPNRKQKLRPAPAGASAAMVLAPPSIVAVGASTSGRRIPPFAFPCASRTTGSGAAGSAPSSIAGDCGGMAPSRTQRVIAASAALTTA